MQRVVFYLQVPKHCLSFAHLSTYLCCTKSTTYCKETFSNGVTIGHHKIVSGQVVTGPTKRFTSCQSANTADLSMPSVLPFSSLKTPLLLSDPCSSVAVEETFSLCALVVSILPSSDSHPESAVSILVLFDGGPTDAPLLSLLHISDIRLGPNASGYEELC